jgi:hypothetical protein
VTENNKTHHWRRLLSLWIALVTLLFGSSVFAQVRRGPLPVLGLRAPDGEDEAAEVATASLRRSATRAGFTVPDNSPALEQLIAAFGCDDSVPVECLRQIANHINAPRFLYGYVRRAGPRRATAPVRLEVRLFDVSAGAPTPPSQTELPRAQALDEDRWHVATEQVIRALLPAPTVSEASTGQGSGQGSGQRSGPGTVSLGPAQPATPIRRYIGFGAIGLGAAVGIIGAAVGAANYFDLVGQINADAMAIQSGSSDFPTNYRIRSFNNLYPHMMSMNAGASVSGDEICNNLSMPQRLYLVTNSGLRTDLSDSDQDIQAARHVCAARDSAVTTMGTFIGVGGAVMVVGAILVVTDSTPSAQPTVSATAATQAAARSRQNLRPLWALTPVINAQTQGAVFNLRF